MTLWTRVAGAAVLLLAATGCTAETTGSAGPEYTAGSAEGTVGAGGAGAAPTAVDSLTVKGRDPRTGYDRDEFGSPWADTDSNGCDTRVISMLRWVTEVFVQLKPGVVSCAY